MNQEKNYQKSDHNKKQKKIIYRFDQITYYRQNRGLFYGYLDMYIFLPLTKNYLMFIDYFQKKQLTYWTLMQYMGRSCSP